MTGKLFGAALVAAWGLVGWSTLQATAQDSSEQHAAANSETDAAHPDYATTNDANRGRNMTDRQSNDEREQQQSEQRQSNDRQSSDQQRSNDQKQSWNDGDNDRARDQASDRNDSRRNRDQRDWQSQIRFGDGSDRGLAISSIERGTPYYRGGLRQGDVIVLWNGRQIRNQDDFGRWAEYRAGQRIPVTVLRDGRRETINITYDQDRNRQSYEGTQSYGQQSYDSQAFLGVRFETRNRVRGGAVISDVVNGSPAEQAGLKAGDELVAINGREVNSGREVTRIVSTMQPGDRWTSSFRVALRITRKRCSKTGKATSPRLATIARRIQVAKAASTTASSSRATTRSSRIALRASTAIADNARPMTIPIGRVDVGCCRDCGIRSLQD